VRALLARQRHDERRCERVARARTFAELGFELADGADTVWEGGDVVVMPDSSAALLGYGPRSRKAAAAWLEAEMRMAVLPLELRDERLFHLDMALTCLPDGTLLVCEEAFAPASIRTLRSLERTRDVLPIHPEDAVAFGLNLVFVGDAALMGAHVPSVERILSAHGLRPVPVPLDQFHLAGGSAACLTARIHAERAAASTSSVNTAVA
jgi:N-dimethylarginine dimethylaminohydrolase